MIEIEEAVKYFNDCKNKHLRRFSEKTPEGNCIKGWICRKSNRYLGSLLIDEVNGEPHRQFVQSMPKIEYFNDERDISKKYDCIAYEKLDGSCLIIYPLFDEKHEKIIEIIPKTRGRAVADKNFIDLYNKIDKSGIYHYYYKENQKGILMFELYGILNQHEIIHYTTGINIALIGCYDEAKFCTPMDLWLISLRNGFEQPDELFRLQPGSNIVITTRKYRWYLDDIPLEELVQPTTIDAVDKIQYFMEYLNKSYNDINGRIASEGVVLNCIDCNGHQKYIKIKPRDIENKHRSEHGIPRSKIVKEVLKYFDEYSSEIEKIYKEDKNHHTEYLHRMLSEEYDEEIIKKSSKKIERIFMQIWDSKQIPVSVHTLCDELFEKYSSEGITKCMQVFAEEYPFKKKDASTYYNVLKVKFKKNRVDI